MTSSFTMPGGTYKTAHFFRAEAVTAPGNHQSTDPAVLDSGRVATYWVHLSDPSAPLEIAPTPPTRPADYVGQIIAVIPASATSRV
jgi:hypothetical protein